MKANPNSAVSCYWPSNRVAQVRRGRRREARNDVASLPTGGAVVGRAIERPDDSLARRRGPATVEELSQIPGAREALVNYVLLLQEWAERAERDGAAS